MYNAFWSDQGVTKIKDQNMQYDKMSKKDLVAGLERRAQPGRIIDMGDV